MHIHFIIVYFSYFNCMVIFNILIKFQLINKIKLICKPNLIIKTLTVPYHLVTYNVSLEKYVVICTLF